LLFAERQRHSPHLIHGDGKGDRRPRGRFLKNHAQAFPRQRAGWDAPRFQTRGGGENVADVGGGKIRHGKKIFGFHNKSIKSPFARMLE
jgi:hypothetical protein